MSKLILDAEKIVKNMQCMDESLVEDWIAECVSPSHKFAPFVAVLSTCRVLAVNSGKIYSVSDLETDPFVNRSERLTDLVSALAVHCVDRRNEPRGIEIGRGIVFDVQGKYRGRKYRPQGNIAVLKNRRYSYYMAPYKFWLILLL